MEDIQSSYEELMSILLFIASKMACMGPDEVKELEGDMGRVQTRIELWRGRREDEERETEREGCGREEVGEKRWERRGGRGREEGDDDDTIQPCRRIPRRTHKYSKTSRAFTM